MAGHYIVWLRRIETVGKTFARFQGQSRAAYIFLFGAFLGGAVYGMNPPGLIYVWLAAGAIGIILTVIKNSEIPDSRARSRMFLADGLVITAMLLLYSALPVYIGLARGLCLLIAAAMYITLYVRWLDSGRIIAKEA